MTTKYKMKLKTTDLTHSSNNQQKTQDIPRQPHNDCSTEMSIDETTGSQHKSADVSVELDGGYAWVILVAAFFIQSIVDGICYSFGIFFLEFQDYFGEDKDTTSWAGSVLNGTYMLVGEYFQMIFFL